MPNPPEDAPLPRYARLCVVSPHLDDAVLSTFACLSTGSESREVVTVVTRGTTGQVTGWSRLTGFPDTATEHEARRAEDQVALAQLAAQAVHLGAASDARAGAAEGIAAVVEEWARANPQSLRQAQWLLPAGAGRQAPLIERIWRRLKRQPDPLATHAEHVQVRNAFERVLRAAGATAWGYYAEQPYIRQESIESCLRRLQRRTGWRFRIIRQQPDLQRKLHAAGCYASQARFVLGASPAEREAFCGHTEVLFIPQPAPH